jgi:hypothetical protein
LGGDRLFLGGDKASAPGREVRKASSVDGLDAMEVSVSYLFHRFVTDSRKNAK